MPESTIHLLEFCLLLCLVVLLPLVPAYILYKSLPSRASISGPFKGLNIQLTGAFGGYFLVLLVIASLFNLRQQPTRTEVWSVTGKVVLKDSDPRERINHNDFSVQPPTNLLYPDGGFDIDVPVRQGQSDLLVFPKIVVTHEGYMPQTIPLGEQQPTFGAKPYQLKKDSKAKKWIIENPIELEPMPTGGAR